MRFEPIGGIMWAILLVAVLPVADDTVRDRYHLIERNTVHDRDTGKATFTQFLFVNRHGPNEYVEAWRLDKGQGIYHDQRTGDYVLRWQDGDIYREIRALHYRVTHTQFDPEVFGREAYPKEFRRELSKPEPLSKQP